MQTPSLRAAHPAASLCCRSSPLLQLREPGSSCWRGFDMTSPAVARRFLQATTAAMNCAALSTSTAARQLFGSSTRGQLSQRRALQQPQRLRRSAVRASASPENKSQEQPASVFADLERNASLVLQRYDFLSAGLGALAVTTVCVARGQDAVTALWITGASTVVALLLNEVLFNDETHH
jgi:hypothetical protein